MLFHTLDRYWNLSDGVGGAPDEPVTVAEAKNYCRFESSAFDTDFARWISSARNLIERDTSRRLVPQVGQLYLERFPTDGIYLEQVPVTEIESVTYLNGSGARVEWDSGDWRADLSREPGIILPAFGKTWPVAWRTVGSVIVTTSVGYELPADVPDFAKQIILFLVGHWFTNPDLAGLIPREMQDSYQAMVRRLSWGAFP